MTTLALIGAVGALGLMAILLALLPPAPVDLSASVARLDTIMLHGRAPDSRWQALIGRVAAKSEQSENRWWGTPSSALRLLSHATNKYVTRRLTYAALGVALGLVIAMRADAPLLAIPLALVGGAVLSLMPWYTVQRSAARARRDFLQATAALFDLTAQERDVGRAPGQALTAAASVAEDGWAFNEIRSCLRSAQRAGRTPWDAISQLGADIGIEALQDLADIIASASDGAAVSQTLRDKASVLRNAAIEAETVEANKRSEWLFAPVALLVIGLLILLMYPIFNQIPH
jgi:Flp pilus assembly protein TadB